MSSEIFDIAIVGGGVAGCAAALTARRGGRSVVLLAPPDDSGDRFGEFLSPAANDLLRTLDLADAFAEGPHRAAYASYSAWGSAALAERNAIVHAAGPGHVLDRPAFDRMLREAAAQSGADVKSDPLVSATHDGTIWILHPAVGAALGARFVIDCSGRAAVVARSRSRRHQEDRLVAVGAFLTQRDNTVEPTPATLIEAVADGWWYASLLPDRRLVVALFSDADILPPSGLRDLAQWRARIEAAPCIRRWIGSAGFAIDSLPRRASAATTWLETAADTFWAAAGDAAAAFDPLSSHGLTTALWSGHRAAMAAIAALAGDQRPLEAYAASLKQGLADFLAQRRRIYALEQRWATLPFWQRRNGGGMA